MEGAKTSVTVNNCTACGGTHADMEFVERKKPPQRYAFWYSVCPNTSKTILMTIEDKVS